ncbi:MAG: hypothetical protein DBO98_02610 [Candidatus Liberibacter europaeus]|nr:hypothetical protein [Candidatus Liberibacter europaeus]
MILLERNVYLKIFLILKGIINFMADIYLRILQYFYYEICSFIKDVRLNFCCVRIILQEPEFVVI